MPVADTTSPTALLDWFKQEPRRLLLLGPDFREKAKLASQLLDANPGYALCADPGTPTFGAPGCISLARWQQGQWQLLDLVPLCSLDAGRYRLPLLLAVQRLLNHVPAESPLVLLAPGLRSGQAAAELLPALAELCASQLNLDTRETSRIEPQLAAQLQLQQLALGDSEPSRAQRLAQRSQLWKDYLGETCALELNLADIQVIGTPPATSQEWHGHQVALLQRGQMKSLGYIERRKGERLNLRLNRLPDSFDQILLRDATWRQDKLATRPTATVQETESSDISGLVRVELGSLSSTADEPQLAWRVGDMMATLVNGVMGDPLLQLKFLHQKRSLVFDLGDCGRMPLRSAHQVSELFITHAHADHIGGMLWLVRSRIGEFPPMRVYGPPGLIQHIQGMVNGILWDRIEHRAPHFEVHELHGDTLQRAMVIAGRPQPTPLPTQTVDQGQICLDPAFTVRAVELDHGTPVLAYAFEPRERMSVDPQALAELGETPGPWLQEFKQAILSGERHVDIVLPSGLKQDADSLAHRLLRPRPGEKLAYATDFSTSQANQDKLVQLARGAHTLVCESSFLMEDIEQARRTSHLTTQTCASIANQAGVQQLVPFHFSHRYDRRREQVYAELKAHCQCRMLSSPGV